MISISAIKNMTATSLHPTSNFEGADYTCTRSDGARKAKKDQFKICGSRSKIENVFYARSRTVPLILLCISFALIVSSSTQADPPPGYKLVFDEEFNGPLDVAPWTGWRSGHKWIAHTPYGGDFGSAYFTGPSENATTPDPFIISNGILTIKAYQDPMINNHWRSGLLSSVASDGSGFSQALGYWECRMMLPSGQGVWPAFWLDGVAGLNKTRTVNSPEIDILEAFGVDMTVAHHYVHVWTPTGQDLWHVGFTTTGVNLANSWHVYGCLVNVDYIHFYLDGKEVSKTPTPPEATQPLYVMVDLALGGPFAINIPSPTYMYVDYIRAYSL
jgi:beta-glucanase (GH16 family)